MNTGSKSGYRSCIYTDLLFDHGLAEYINPQIQERGQAGACTVEAPEER